MKRFVQFWRKDAINKLIVLVVLFILASVGGLLYLLTATPQGQELLDSFQPTPTVSVSEIFKRGEATKTAEAAQTQRAVIPTITTMPFTPMATLLTPSVTPTTNAPSGPTSDASAPALTASPETASGPTPTQTPLPLSEDCPPGKNPQVGKVLDVIDGSTVQVLMNDLVYVVHYIGVDLPQDENYALLSTVANGNLVYAKEVKLYADGTDKDDSNRLLRYVVVGDSTLVNRELIQRGLATASGGSYRCAATFAAAQKGAQSNQIGMWQTTKP